MLRETFDPGVSNEIKRIIEKDIGKIKSLARKEGLAGALEWERETSLAKLNSLKSRDVDVCETGNAYRFPKKISNQLIHIIKGLYPKKSVYTSGHFYYPPHGFMGWHTNYKVSDERLYVTFASEGGKSFFRYEKNGEIITDFDNKGLTFRRFSVSSVRPYLWHCVGSDCDRFSFGYRLCDTI